MTEDCADSSDGSNEDLKILILSKVAHKIQGRPLARLLRLHDISFNQGATTSQMRSRLKEHIRGLQRGKRAHIRQARRTAASSVSVGISYA